MIRILTVFLISLSIYACTPTKQAVISEPDNDEVLYILPDGTMEFRGRVIDRKDVVIYEDGRGGERAAVKLDLPLYNHAWRDTIDVERVTFDVPIARQQTEEEQTNTL